MGTPKSRHIGLLTSDIFKTRVPVYTSPQDYVDALTELGATIEDDIEDGAYLAFVGVDYVPLPEEQGGGALQFLSLMMPVEAEITTWVHECSHLADFILERVGIPLTTEHTEIKALLITNLFDQLTQVMNQHEEKMRKRALAYERRQRKKAEQLNIEIAPNSGYH